MSTSSRTRTQRIKSKPDVSNTSKTQKKNTVKKKHPEKKIAESNIKDIIKTDNLNKQFLTPLHIKRFVCKICKKRFDRKYLFKKHIFLHSKRRLNTANCTKLRKESLKNIGNILRVKTNKFESKAVTDVPEIVSFKEITETILGDDEPDTIFVKDEPEIFSVKDISDIISVKDLPETILVIDEPKTILLKDTKETIFVKDESEIVSVKAIPEIVSVKNEPETIFVRDESEGPDKNNKIFNHVIQRLNDIETLPELPEIKVRITKSGKRQCKRCLKVIQTEKDDEAHTICKPKPPVKKLLCEYCLKKFASPSDLKRHSTVHTEERTEKCAICNKVFKHTFTLTKHMLTHLNVKPFKCEICNKQFGIKDTFKRHILTHSIKKPFECMICEKKFIRSEQLQQHLKMRHPDNQKNPFLCPICNKMYKRKSSFEEHLKFCHQNQSE